MSALPREADIRRRIEHLLSAMNGRGIRYSTLLKQELIHAISLRSRLPLTSAHASTRHIG